MLFRFLLIVIVFTISLNSQMLSRTQVLMGTYVSISLDDKDKNYIENGFDIVRDIDLSISSFNENAQIYKLNRNKRANINKYTYEALELSKKYHEISDGYFDISVGVITKDIYSFGDKDILPKISELENATVNFHGLLFNQKKAYIAKDIKLDLGGMGKGFAVDKVVQYLKDKNIKKATISLSGDIRCIHICSLKVQNPFRDGVLASFETAKKDMGISTSGNYKRYVDSSLHNHLINPKLKKPQDKFISITLIGELANADLDAYATTASVMPRQKAYEFLESFELAYIILQSDEKLVISENISEYTNNLLLHDGFKK